MKTSSSTQRDDAFWSKISEKIHFYNKNSTNKIGSILAEIGLVEYDGKAFRIDIDSDIFMSAYPNFETAFFTISVFYVALHKLIADLSDDDEKNIKDYVISESNKIVEMIEPIQTADKFTPIFRNRYNDYLKVCNNEFSCGISLNDDVGGKIDRISSPSRCAMLYCDFMAYFKTQYSIWTIENMTDLQNSVNSFTQKENRDFHKLYNILLDITNSIFADIKMLLDNNYKTVEKKAITAKPNKTTKQKQPIIFPPKADKPYFSMRWNNAYCIILIVLGVLRIIGVLTSVANIWSVTSYYYLPNEGLFVFLGIVCVIIQIVRVVLTFRLSSGLKTPQRDVFHLLIAYLIVNILGAGLGTQYSYFYQHKGVGIAIISAVFTSIYLIPIFIYYYKRRSLFGITFFCDRCGKQFSSMAKRLMIDSDTHEEYHYCESCYCTINKSKLFSENKKSQTPNHATKSSTKTVVPKKTVNQQVDKPKTQNDTHHAKTNSKIRYCRKCGCEIDDETIYCKKCGCKIIKDTKCPSCGAALDDDSLFCKKCGKKIE